MRKPHVMVQVAIKFAMMDLHIQHMAVLTMAITPIPEQHGGDQPTGIHPMDILMVVMAAAQIGPMLIMVVTVAEQAIVGS